VAATPSPVEDSEPVLGSPLSEPLEPPSLLESLGGVIVLPPVESSAGVVVVGAVGSGRVASPGAAVDESSGPLVDATPSSPPGQPAIDTANAAIRSRAPRVPKP
jgi:hypothetical protein